MMTKEEYTALYFINYGRNSIDRLKSLFNDDENITEKLVMKLEKKGLIRIQEREGRIYSFMETEGGLKLLKSKEYAHFYNELGD